MFVRILLSIRKKEFEVVLKYQNTPYIIQVLISVLISNCQLIQEKKNWSILMLLIGWHLILITIYILILDVK